MNQQHPTRFDRTVAKAASGVLAQALSGIQSDDFKLVAGGGTLSDNELTIKVCITLKHGADPDRATLEMFCRLAGYDPDATLSTQQLGKIKLVRYDSRKRSYPWIVRSEADGKQYKMSNEQVARAYAAAGLLAKGGMGAQS